jgi:RIO kinase 1
MSGKEAQIYLVRGGGELRVAKVYKEAHARSFKQRAEYTEGRNVRNSRDQRAMSKRTRHGREQDEAAWRTAEVEMIYRLRAAGVRVPVPHHYVDGVLIMELVSDAEGNPAPRLGDLNLDAEHATEVFDRVLAEVVRMLAAGVVHGDLSDFNVLMGSDGPVIIDFPQAVDASGNQNARKLLVRDVDNLHRFLAKVIPGRQPPPFAQEMWQLYERGELTADTKLNGRYRVSEKKVNTEDVSALIAEAERDEHRRRDSLGLRMRGGSGPQQAMPQPRQQQPRQQQPRQQQPRQQQPQPRPPQPRQQQLRPPQPRPQHVTYARPPQPRAPQPSSQRAQVPPDGTPGVDTGVVPSKRKRRRRRRKPSPGPA